MNVSRFDPFEIAFQINVQLIIEKEGSCVDVSRFTSIQIYFPIDFQIFSLSRFHYLEGRCPYRCFRPA